jgi:dephospho-CoA kinase
VVLDGALLLNSALKDYCDVILYVDAPRKVRIARLINRGVSKSIAIQMSEAVNIKKQDILKSKKPIVIINNDGSTNELMEKISNVVKIGVFAKIKS